MVKAAITYDATEGTLYPIRGEFLEMPGLRLTTELAAYWFDPLLASSCVICRTA